MTISIGSVITALAGILLTLLIGIIGWFLKRLIDELTNELNGVKTMANDTKIKLGLVELDNRNKYNNLLDKIELLFTQMDKLITEVKDINKNINNRR